MLQKLIVADLQFITKNHVLQLMKYNYEITLNIIYLQEINKINMFTYARLLKE